MFSVNEKQLLAAEIEKLLLALHHPEMPTERPSLRLHVDGIAPWSYADIEPNWKYAETVKDGTAGQPNVWNEVAREVLGDQQHGD